MANLRCVHHLKKAFANRRLIDVGAEEIELYLRVRLRQRVKVRTGKGYRELGLIKATTVHQEMRVLRRMLNGSSQEAADIESLCDGGVPRHFDRAIPSALCHLLRTGADQERRNAASAECHPHHCGNRVVSEEGTAPGEERPNRLSQRGPLDSRVQTPNGVAEIPLTKLASDAFQSQVAISGNGEFLFPSDLNQGGHLRSLRTAWSKALKRARIPYFRLYDLRSTYATRLSAAGVADEWVIQMLRQGDSHVFKKYSQMKLQMKREALDKINRRANEMSDVLTQEGPVGRGFDTVLTQ